MKEYSNVFSERTLSENVNGIECTFNSDTYFKTGVIFFHYIPRYVPWFRSNSYFRGCIDYCYWQNRAFLYLLGTYLCIYIHKIIIK